MDPGSAQESNQYKSYQPNMTLESILKIFWDAASRLGITGGLSGYVNGS